MRIVIRALVLGVFVAGASAAVATSHSAMTPVVSHQSVSAALPMPACTPGVPGCK